MREDTQVRAGAATRAIGLVETIPVLAELADRLGTSIDVARVAGHGSRLSESRSSLTGLLSKYLGDGGWWMVVFGVDPGCSCQAPGRFLVADDSWTTRDPGPRLPALDGVLVDDCGSQMRKWKK